MHILRIGLAWILGMATGGFGLMLWNTASHDRTYLYRRAVDGPVGLIDHDPSRSQPGYTLYTSGHESGARLINPQGDVVHHWKKKFSEVHNSKSSVRFPRVDERVYWRKAKLLDNGDLLVVYEGDYTFPFGYGLIKFDKDSNVIWKFLNGVHHDVEVGEDGRIYTLTHEKQPSPPPDYGFLPDKATVYDAVAILSPDGALEKHIDLFSAISKSKYFARLKQRIQLSDDGKVHTDYLHANAVEPLTAAGASKIPGAEAGDILVSFRDIDTIGVIDAESGVFIWIANGHWRHQHDPDFLANGNILLFDNEGDYSGAGTSRVVEYDPVTDEIVWSYGGTPEKPLESFVRSAQQRLPNGNTLITESDRGRIVEVTSDKNIVWEYVNPALGGKAGSQVAVVSWAQRIDVNQINFELNGGRLKP